MKCVLVAIGWENIALQALSALLKENGHEVHLVYDQALFDDKNYLSIPWMAKIFEQKELVIQRIIELEPDLVGFHVQTVQYHEMRDMAEKIKQHYNVPVIFGGIHPHSSPDKSLLKEVVVSMFFSKPSTKTKSCKNKDSILKVRFPFLFKGGILEEGVFSNLLINQPTPKLRPLATNRGPKSTSSSNHETRRFLFPEARESCLSSRKENKESIFVL